MAIRGIRGATTVKENTKDAILNETEKLLNILIQKNNIKVPDIASIFFSLTDDLNAIFPAEAARKLGLNDTPLLCVKEINVPKSMTKCIRILFHLNTDKQQKEMIHVYLNDAKALRPDLHQTEN